MGEPSTAGQPTRPTQPFILSGSINEYSWNQMCAAVYRQHHLVKATEVTAGLAESNGSLLPGLWHDSLHVTCELTACTPGSAPGPTLGNEYAKTLPFLETVSGSGIIWDICKSAPRTRQITMPAPHRSVFFTGRMPFLPPNQQCQSTEGKINVKHYAQIITIHIKSNSRTFSVLIIPLM